MSRLHREMQRIRNSALARNAGWMLMGQGVGALLQAAYFVILARLLGPVQYGVFVGAFAFTSLASPYCSLGSGLIFLRYVSSRPAALAAYWGNILLSVIVMGGILTALLALCARHLLNASSAPLVLLAAISNCLFAPLVDQIARIFQCFQRMKLTVIVNLLTNLVRTLTAVAMFVALHHATALQWTLGSTVVSGLAAVAACSLVFFLYGRPHFDLKLSLAHGAEGLGFSFAATTTSVYNDVDKAMLSHYGMNAANGIYSTAYKVVDIATMPIYSVREAVYPKLFQHGQKGIASAAQLSNRLLLRTAPASLFVAACMFFAAPLIPHILGASFSQSVLALRWLSLIPVLRCVHITVGSVLTGAGMQKYRTEAQVGAALLNVLLNLWAIPSFGWLGAAWTSLITDGALAVALCVILRRVLVSKTTSLGTA